MQSGEAQWIGSILDDHGAAAANSKMPVVAAPSPVAAASCPRKPGGNSSPLLGTPPRYSPCLTPANTAAPKQQQTAAAAQAPPPNPVVAEAVTRSCSAPPSVVPEASVPEFRLDQLNVKGGNQDFRMDPAYHAYYYAQRPLDPRLPPPIFAWNWNSTSPAASPVKRAQEYPSSRQLQQQQQQGPPQVGVPTAPSPTSPLIWGPMSRQGQGQQFEYEETQNVLTLDGAYDQGDVGDPEYVTEEDLLSGQLQGLSLSGQGPYGQPLFAADPATLALHGGMVPPGYPGAPAGFVNMAQMGYGMVPVSQAMMRQQRAAGVPWGQQMPGQGRSLYGVPQQGGFARSAGGQDSAPRFQSPSFVPRQPPVVPRAPVPRAPAARGTYEEDDKEVIGHVFELSQDQLGSRYLQQRLEDPAAGMEFKQIVFKEALPHGLALMNDVFGNYVIQKLIEYGNPEQRATLFDNVMRGNVFSLSMSMYGCRVVQKALDCLDDEYRARLVSELTPTMIANLIQDQNGNHVVQKCVETCPDHVVRFVVDSLKSQVHRLAVHPYGCRVIQRILEHADANSQSASLLSDCGIIECLLEHTSELVTDQYGNYVIQHLLEKGTPQQRECIIRKLRGSLVQLSMHKFASNVVEKCILHCSPAERRQIVTQEMLVPDDALVSMMQDQYANYVVQKVIDAVDDEVRAGLFGKIRGALPTLRKLTYGKHILSHIERYYHTALGSPLPPNSSPSYTAAPVPSSGPTSRQGRSLGGGPTGSSTSGAPPASSRRSPSQFSQAPQPRVYN